MIFINFKTYKQGTGEKAVELAKICQEAEKETSVKIIPVVQAVDLFRLSGLGIEIWVQHLDAIEFGSHTGQVLPEAVLAAGAKGTILNHSENKLPAEIIGEAARRCQEIDLKVLICCESVEEGKKIAKFQPDFLAYEPPELIGGDVSVSKTKPEVIKDFIDQIPGISIIIGAGIHTQADIQKGLELGTKGFLVSSDVVLAKDPKEQLVDLAEGFKG